MTSGERICFVINLERSPERLNAIAAQLERAGIDFERFPAIDGREVDPGDASVFDRRAYEFRHGKAPTPNEIGCCLSHVGALRAFLATPAQRCLILEDDAIVPVALRSILERLDRLRAGWDMVFLYGNHEGSALKLTALDRDYDLVAYFTRQTGAVAYLVNRKAAQAFIGHILPMSLPFDRDFDRAWDFGIKIRGVRPLPVKTGAHVSDIGSIGAKFAFHRRLGTFVTRGLTETRRTLHYLFADPIWLYALVAYIGSHRHRDAESDRITRT